MNRSSRAPLNLALGLAIVLSASGPAVAGENGAEAAAAEAGVAEGPYVFGRENDWRARSVDAGGEASEVEVRKGRVHVAPVDGVAGFEVKLRPPPQTASSHESLAKDAPLFVVADTHGEYAILVALLKAQRIVDERLRWSFGNGHLVISGDMVDRGPRQLEILWLLYKLEAEARAAGGRVHVLIGNHEALVLRGEQRYLHPRYPEIARRLGASGYSQLLGGDTVLGAWLRSRPAMLKLGDLLIVHGGVSAELAASGLDLDEINAISRRYLDIPHTMRAPEGSREALVVGASGPLWYRGYFPIRGEPPAATNAEVAASLDRFGVSRILVGHTMVESVLPLYGGKVIAVQVYPHIDAASGLPVLEGAMRLDGTWYRATAQGKQNPLAVIAKP